MTFWSYTVWVQLEEVNGMPFQPLSSSCIKCQVQAVFGAPVLSFHMWNYKALMCVRVGRSVGIEGCKEEQEGNAVWVFLKFKKKKKHSQTESHSSTVWTTVWLLIESQVHSFGICVCAEQTSRGDLVRKSRQSSQTTRSKTVENHL